MRASKPKTFARSRERYRALHSGSFVRASDSGLTICWREVTATFYAWQLFHIAFLRVVVEAETQREVGSVIFRW
jgi:hypothetical protein